MVAYKHYPRWASWQVASVLNPSLQYTLPHSREKRERGKAYTPWREQDEESGRKLPLPPQYVSASDLCKAMPKYQARPKSKPAPFSIRSPRFSPRYDLAAGSPRSPPHPSGRETPRSVLDFPHHEQPKPPAQQAATSPRIRSVATSPRRPISGVAPDATLLRSKLDALVQCPETVVQMECTAQGSPLSPANSVEASRLATPPLRSRARRVRKPHPPEPTLETYQKASPNTHATNTVWNDRRDMTSREQSHPRQSILIKST